MRGGALRTLVLAIALVEGSPAAARIDDLDVQPSSFVAIEAGSGIYLDLPTAAGGTRFVPLAAQGTSSLRAPLGGRIRVDFVPGDATPTLSLLGRSTLLTPAASGSWLPGLPASPALAAPAQSAASFGAPTALPAGLAALRELAVTIDASHPLSVVSPSAWAWPDGPFSGPGADTVELAIATGVVDLDSSLTPKTRLLLTEGTRAALALSTARRARVRTWAGGEQIEVRIPIDAALETDAATIHSTLPVRVRLELGGEIVARNFVPEPTGALAGAAALGGLAWLGHRRRDAGRRGMRRLIVELVALLFLIGAACADSTDREGDEPALQQANVTKVTATTTGEANDAGGCEDGTENPCDEDFEATALAAAPGTEASVEVEAPATFDGIVATIHLSNTTTRSEFDSTTQVDVDANFEATVPAGGADAIRVRLLGTPEGHDLSTDATATLSFPDHPGTPPTGVPADGQYHEVALPPGLAPGSLAVAVSLHVTVEGVCAEQDCSVVFGPWEAGVVYALDVFGRGDACSHDAQCAGGENCVNGVCSVGGVCFHPADCPGGTVCTETGCDPLGTNGEHCVADGDCASDDCDATSGTCNACPGDDDCDHIANGLDGCPNDPGTEDGCEEEHVLPDGRVAHCADADTCSFGPSGGGCTRCGIADGEHTADCFESGSCFAVPFAPTGCSDGCVVRGSAGSEVECTDTCSLRAGRVECSGRCDANVPGIGSTGCSASACDVIVMDEDDPLSRAELIFVKRTAPGSGDGSFRFLFDNYGPLFERTLTTSGGVSHEIHLIAKVSRLNVYEDRPEGWNVSFDCDGPFGSAIHLEPAIQTNPAPGGRIRCTATNTRTGGTGLLPVFDAPETVEPANVPGQTGPFVIVAGAGGWRVVNPQSGAIPSVAGVPLQSLFFETGFLGARLIDDPGNATDVGVYTFAAGGVSLREWQTATQIGFGTGRDAIFPGNDATLPRLLTLTAGNVSEVGYFDAAEFPTYGTPIVDPFELSGLGVATSLFAANPVEQVLLATSGPTAGQNGRLVRIDPDVFNSDVVIGETEVDPRRVRWLNGVGVVSNHGSDSITRFTWDGGANAAIVGTTPTGDGPIGVALAADGSNVLAATANFNDSTLTTTVLDANAGVVASRTDALPAGCEEPGGVAWVDLPVERVVVVACRRTDNLAVLAPAIPTPP